MEYTSLNWLAGFLNHQQYVESRRSGLLRCSTCCVPFHPVSHPNIPVSPSLSAVAAEAPIKPHDVFCFFRMGKFKGFFVFEKSHLIKHLHCFFSSDVCCILLETEQTRKMVQMLSPWGFCGDTRETKKYLLPSGNLTWQWNIPSFNRKYILKGLC